VDLFFVLSGFLITGRLLPYLDEPNILMRFYRNRFLRIVPLYFAFLIIFFLCWFLLLPESTLKTFLFYSNHWWQFFLFIQNWIFIQDISESKTHLQHLWSVAVEEQIYLLFPLFLYFVKNKKTIFYSILAICIVILISRSLYTIFWLPTNNFEIIFWNTFFRLDSFFAGVIIYFLYNKIISDARISNLISLILLLCLLTILTKIIITYDAEKNNLFIATFGYTIIALMYGGLLWLILSKKNKILNSITSARFLRYTGKISYGLYIIHWPLFIVGFGLLNNLFSSLGFSVTSKAIHTINVIICIPTAYFISHLSFRYYESYFLKRKKHVA
jgi:peptidoglycan/LPS O-acetylase OafA/YrhL